MGLGIHGLGRDMGCMREMADALWEVHTLLKTGLSAHRHTHTDRHIDRSENSISASFTVHSVHLADIINFD